MKDSVLKRYILFTIGVVIFGIGISFSVKSGLGSNPLTVLVMGVDVHVPLSMGTCNLLVGIVMTIFGYVLDREHITLATFICLFGASYAIDLGAMIIPDCFGFTMQFIYSICGLLLYSFGLAVQIQSKAGLSNYDAFIFGMNKILNKMSYHQVRWIVDGVFLVSGCLLGGIVNLGTVEMLLFSGLLIEFFMNHISF